MTDGRSKQSSGRQNPLRNNIRSCRRETERGAAAVEFMVIGIVLLTMLFGFIAFGEALYAYNLVSEAAREGTRYAMVRGSTCAGFASACPASASDVQTYVQGILSPEIYVNPTAGGPGSVTVNTTWPGGVSGCAATGGVNNTPGCPVQVQVQYNFTLALPFLSVTTLNLSSTSQMTITQ